MQMATLTADQGYAIAYEHYRNARYAEAERLCQQVLTAAPEHVESWMLYALMAHRFGRTAEGDHLLDMAVRNKQASIRLDAEYDVRPRWAPHAGLNAMLQAGLPRYAEVLRSFESFLPWLDKIAFDADPLRPADPCWNNIWLPVLDAAALYCLIAQKRPRYYVEVGSGNSTRFAARAIADHGLATRIVSIDPQPRAEIDALCHEVIRQPLEKCDLGVFSELGANDVIFADNSHRSFMNSDVTVFFCDILPQLASGVIAGIHDIFLPHDYPAEWDVRYYSEQYLLACYLLAGTRRFDVLLPVFFAAGQGQGNALLPQVRNRNDNTLWRTGSSFWLTMR